MDKKAFCSASFGVVIALAGVEVIRSWPEPAASAESNHQHSSLETGASAPVGTIATTATARRVIPFQAYLTGSDGRPVSGAHAINFQLFDSPEGGLALPWTETHPMPGAPPIAVSRGLVNLTLGSIMEFPSTISFAQRLFIEVAVDGGEPLKPRHEIISAVHAWNAEQAVRSDSADVSAYSQFTRFTLDGKHVQDIGYEEFANDGQWHEIPGTSDEVLLPAGRALLMYSLGSVWLKNGAGELKFRPSVRRVTDSFLLTDVPVFQTFVHEPPTSVLVQGDQTISTNVAIQIPTDGVYRISLEIMPPVVNPVLCIYGNCNYTGVLRTVQWTILSFPAVPNQ